MSLSVASIFLRPATPADAKALAKVAGQTFRDGWACILSPAVADAYIAEALTPERLAAEIEDPSQYLVVAVEGEDRIVGYARVVFGKAAPACVTGNAPALLQRLYVIAEQRGRHVADALLQDATREALRRKAATFYLEAEPRNERAWRFYLKRGFVDVGGTVYHLTGGAVNDQMRVLQKALHPAIRPGTPKDAHALSRMAAEVFHATFAHTTDPAVMTEYLARAFHPGLMEMELANPDNLYLLAVHGEQIVGYTKLGFVSDESPSCVTGPGPIAELERFYVSHSWHGTGVADTLMSATLNAASERGTRSLWLGVYEENERARRFYARWGFRDVGTHIFMMGDEEQTDKVMCRSLEN
jgi:ribosomal protein S18 acetylase RimI-like enzyme